MGSPLPNLPGFLPSIPPCVDPNKPSLGRAQTLVYKNGYAIDRLAATGQHPSATIGAAPPPPSPPTKRALQPPLDAVTTTTAGSPPPPLALPLAGAPPPPTTYQASFCGAGRGGGGSSPPPAGATTQQQPPPRPLDDEAEGDLLEPPLPPAAGLAALGLSSSSLPPANSTTNNNTTTTKRKNELAEYAEARLGKPSHLLEGGGAALGRFLASGGRVLRFSARWDDASAAAFGDSRRRFVLALHLEDDTVEVIEVAGGASSSGAGAAAAAAAAPPPLLNQPGGNVFLRRAPLPKTTTAAGPSNNGNGAGVAPLHLLSARRALPREAFVTADDLRVGGTVAVHGRRFVLTGCDEATKAYCREALGLQGEADAEFFGFDGGAASGGEGGGGAGAGAAAAAAARAAAARPALPPHNGIGDPEDTLMNCLSLVPRRPPKDLVRLMNKDNVALVFQCRLAGSEDKAARAEAAAAEARRACAAGSTGGGGGALFGVGASATFHAKPTAAAASSSSSGNSSANAKNPKALAAAASEAAAAAAAARAEASRRFVLTYYYGDNTIAIHEPPVRNSGVPGGRFLERGVVRRPPLAGAGAAAGKVAPAAAPSSSSSSSSAAAATVGEPLTHSDFYVGAIVPVHGRSFELVAADSFTLDYMEQNSAHGLFAAADARGAARATRAQIVRRAKGCAERAAADLRTALLAEAAAQAEGGAEGEGQQQQQPPHKVTDAGLHRALESGLGVACVAHQALALRRAADPRREGAAAVDDVVALVMGGGMAGAQDYCSWSTQGGGC